MPSDARNLPPLVGRTFAPSSMAKYRVLATRQLLGGKKQGSAAAKLRDRGSLELPKLPPKLLEEHVRSQPAYLEPQSLVGMVSPAYAVVEAAGVVTLEVERTATTMPLMVDFSTCDLTATASEDYEPTSGTLKYEEDPSKGWNVAPQTKPKRNFA